MCCVPRGDPLRSLGIFHLRAACRKPQNNVCPRSISLKCIFPILWRSFGRASLPETCIYLVFARGVHAWTYPPLFYEKETQVLMIQGSKGPILKQGFPSIWNIPLVPAYFVLAAPYFYGSISRGNGLIPALRVKSFMLSVVQPFSFGQQSHITFNLFSQVFSYILAGLIMCFCFFSLTERYECFT